MESRKLKRYDSAPISSGASASASAAAAAARAAAAHVTNLPRPQAGITTTTATAKPTINASTAAANTTSHAVSAASTAAGAVNASDPYEKQLEAYYRCMEEDNQSLLTYYETHTMDIASLKVLAQERKYKESVMRAMEAKVAAMDAFLVDVMDVAAPTRGLRARGDTNLRESGKSSSAKNNAANSTAVVPSMHAVREAVVKLQSTLQATTASEEKHRIAIEVLEKEVAEWKEKARPRTARTRSGAADSAQAEDDGVVLPGTAKELREAQRKIRDLERRLSTATNEARDAAAAIRQLEQQQRTTNETLQRRDEEVIAMRSLLNTKEQLLSSYEAEVKTARSTGASGVVGPRGGSGRYVRTNSAPAGQQQQQQGHFFGGETSSDRLVVTHHYRLLGGQRFVDGRSFSPESFKDALLRSISTMLHVPYGYLTNVELRTHAEAVSIELDIRHSARLSDDEIDFRLLSHDYPEVMSYLEKVATELAAQTPLDPNAARVRELQATLAERDNEVAHLRRRLRGLEASLERRDADREGIDKDVDAALQETENTVQDLYAALQAAQQEAEKARKSLSTKALQARVAEQAKDAVVNAAAAAERSLQEEVSRLTALVAAAKEDAAQATTLAKAEAKGELRVVAFQLDVPLPTSSTQRVAAQLLSEAPQTRIVHALLLAHAGRTGGAIPMQVKSCVLGDGVSGEKPTTSASRTAASAAVLRVTVELAYFAAQHEADTLKAEVQEKLRDGGACSVLVEYLRLRDDAARREAAAAAEAQRAVSEAEQRAAAAFAAVRSETQREHETKLDAAVRQLQEVGLRVSSVLPDTLSSSSNSNSSNSNVSVVKRVEVLVTRLTSAEAAARRHEEASQRAARRLAEAQQEREQLQQTLSELTERCAEVRVAREQLESRLCTAEGRLTTSGAAEAALSEKVRRLEAALRSSAATADAERERWATETRAAQVLTDSLRTELSAKEKELQLTKQSATSAPTASCSSGKGSASEEAALREALRIAKEDRTALARQVREMDIDMNDLSNIQAAMQRELESAQQELRAKKHDFDLLVKQLIRMEEKEKKWQADQRMKPEQQQQQQQQQLSSPDSPSRQHDEEAEKDDVARESLVVLTNSNTNLQQCLRKMQRTMSAMGMNVRIAPSALSTSTTVSGVEEQSGSGRTRRSGHRKGALSATVSRAAMDHQQLSSQLAELLFPMLSELERCAGPPSTHENGGRDSGAAFARTSSYQSVQQPGGAPVRIVKQHLSSSPFARTRSTPVVLERAIPNSSSSTDAGAASVVMTSQRNTPKKERSASDAAFASPTVVGSGGKATVDAAPRLDFHRQGSGRSFMRSNTATTAPAMVVLSSHNNNSNNANTSAGLPPASSNTANLSDGEKERRSKELPHRRTGSGAAGSGGSYANAPRRYNANAAAAAASTTTAKTNPFRRSNTATANVSGGPTTAAAAATASSLSAVAAAGGGVGVTAPASSGVGASFVRVNSGYRRTPTSTTLLESGAATAGASQTHKPYRMRF